MVQFLTGGEIDRLVVAEGGIDCETRLVEEKVFGGSSLSEVEDHDADDVSCTVLV